MVKRIGIICAAIIPVAIIGFLVMKPSDDAVVDSGSTGTSSGSITTTPIISEASSGTGTDSGSTAPTNSGTTAAASTYADGTYTATGSYNTPEGAQSIQVTLEIVDDVVKNAIVVPEATVGTVSSMWQEKFTSGYGAIVFGKSFVDLKLTKVSGSSLTPMGFNAAVATIQSQAKS